MKSSHTPFLLDQPCLVALLLRSRGLTPPTFCQFAWRTGFWYSPTYRAASFALDRGSTIPDGQLGEDKSVWLDPTLSRGKHRT